jgi:hypothetical protein
MMSPVRNASANTPVGNGIRDAVPPQSPRCGARAVYLQNEQRDDDREGSIAEAFHSARFWKTT